MIESRYKIEYELPDDDVKKSPPFRVLWYLLLIPLVLLAVTAITYDFSLQNIKRDSSVLVEKAKIHIFNLGDSQQFKKPVTPSSNMINATVENGSEKKDKSETKSVTNRVIAKPIDKPLLKNDGDKKIINELTAKQQLQLKTIEDQIAKNEALNKDLNLLSSQLVMEKTKNESLFTRLSEEEKDRLELEQQLNEMLSESKVNQINLEKIADKKEEIITAKEISIETEKINIEEKNKALALSTESTSEENIQSLAIDESAIVEVDEKQNQVQIEEQKKEESETDKIIAAMATANSNSDIKSETATSSKSEINSEISVDNNQDKTIDEEINNNKVVADKEENIKPEIKELTVVETEEKQLESSIVNDEKIVKDEIESEAPAPNNTKPESAIKEPVVSITEPEIKKEEVQTTAATEVPQSNSAVDDIIAAMQQSESNTSNEKVDPKLEKDIKQQLVEQGELSVDN